MKRGYRIRKIGRREKEVKRIMKKEDAGREVKRPSKVKAEEKRKKKK